MSCETSFVSVLPLVWLSTSVLKGVSRQALGVVFRDPGAMVSLRDGRSELDRYGLGETQLPLQHDEIAQIQAKRGGFRDTG